jgi:hypothetical protein
MNYDPFTGAFYWLPSPDPSGPSSWSLLTCHDLRVWDGISHWEMWPHVLSHLAGLWGKAPEPFGRRLGDHYYALPRGRVTNPSGRYLILHGNDVRALVPEWRAIIVDRFRLDGLPIRTPWDEHEQTLSEDVFALGEALGVALDFPRT